MLPISQKKQKTKETTRGQLLLGNQSLHGTCGVSLAGKARIDLEPAVKRQLCLLSTGHWFEVTCDLSGRHFHSNTEQGCKQSVVLSVLGFKTP